MRVGFLRADVIKGGQYEDLYYNNIIIPDRKPERIGNYFAVDVDDDEFGYSWLAANHANVRWQYIGIFVETPSLYKTTTVPTWLPNRDYTDENGDPQIHDFESWGGVVRESIDTTKIILKITLHDDLVTSQLDDLATFLGTEPLATAMLTDETRTLLETPEYKAPE